MFSQENAGERHESKAPGAQGTRQYIKYGEGISTAQRRYRTAQQVFWVKP